MADNLPRKRLLIVEDEHGISELIKFNAEMAGYECDTAFDGPSGLRKASGGSYDLILLDIMLPGLDGFEVCRRLRADMISTPIIMVTAREEEADKVLGLELGADDYIPKPFKIPEFLARIKANIRRASAEVVPAPRGNGFIRIKNIEIDSEHYDVRRDGVPVELSAKEYDVLVLFAKNPGRVITREELLDQVWGNSDGKYFGDEHTVDVTIFRLKSKLGESGSDGSKIIQNVRGKGWFIARE